jgi:cytochrome b subunit of formate dehydrogenase
MMSSFLLLASTGLPLKFSHSAIAYWIATHLANLHTMAIAHRVGAVMTFAYFSLHISTLLYLRFIKKDKNIFWGPGSLVPNMQDARDLWGHFKWFFGQGEQPRFGRWTYWEKFDYFAVFWGVAIIGSSGLVLWFPEFYTRLLPGWTISLAHIVHSEEALLAVGFIFTVHFFNSHLRPGKFPMDQVIFTGRIAVHELEEERPREWEELQVSGSVERAIVAAMPVWRKRLLQAVYILGFSTGITLLGFIVAGMLL